MSRSLCIENLAAITTQEHRCNNFERIGKAVLRQPHVFFTRLMEMLNSGAAYRYNKIGMVF
jgi:hypothetical protein